MPLRVRSNARHSINRIWFKSASRSVAMEFAVAKYRCGLMPYKTRLQRTLGARIRIKKGDRRFAVKAARSDESERPHIADEDMLVLRKQIHQLRMAEMNHIPPQHWIEWVKKWYPTYHSDVCLFMVWFQSLLLNARPSVAVGIVAFVSFGVPASVWMLLNQSVLHFKQLIMELLSNFNA